MSRMPLRALVTATAATGALLIVTAGVAAAHIDPDVSQIPAGAKATVTFTVEHGCGESPTTKLEIKVPASVTDAAAVTKAEWTSATSGDVVTITGGPLDAHTEDTFAITFTAPSK